VTPADSPRRSAVPPRRRRPRSVAEGWRALPPSLAVLRAFLGVTFLYAGVQKLLDPTFLRAGGADYIGTQLRGFAQGSPIGWLLDALSHLAVPTGVAIAMVEIAIGLGTLLGIAPRATALGGLLVNVALLLSATWHVHPYFLGSDSVYAIAWAAYLIGLFERERGAAAMPLPPAPSSRARRTIEADEIRRRELLRGATLAGATLATTAIAKALSGTPAAATLAATAQGAVASSSATRGTRTPTPKPARSSPAVTGTPVARLSRIPVGGAVGFRSPSGTPCALIRLGRNDVVAFSRVCTHAGCLVGYDQAQRILYCPCHGAEYDPSRGAAVIAGPAPRPLPEIPVKIDPATGEVVVPS
jgi:thiosulfate dehydrogenase [quinone] large subunit